jgi:glycosyltransferase involved in cell wall biosynthesis
MKNQNKFIILITAYNDEEWVEYNIASILNQTYSNYKVLYYDDASTDNTYKVVSEITQDNNKFTINTRKKNMQALFSAEECIKQIKEDEILICLSGDDWLFDDNVLENLNNYYNNNDVWMTYGKFIGWDGENTIPPSLQNSHYPDFVHNYSLYRKDHWRASHLRTFRGSLLKKVDLSEFKSNINNSYYDHASDLALTYPCLEMCGKDKIGVLDFYSYVYNMTPDASQRTQNREGNVNNHKFESEIRNRKVYKKLKNINHTPQKLPQVNTFGDYKERHTIPKNFSYTYNLSGGEFDITLLQDGSIIDYLEGRITVNENKPIIALIAEGPHLFNQNLLYDRIQSEYAKFDKVLGWHESLYNLPNFKFKPITEISQWSLLPIELDITQFQVYNKTKKTSFITSNKSMVKGHQFRLDCLTEIQKQKLNVDAFGRGINPINSKLEGLKDYQFSIAMENAKMKNYFTEKLLDCMLAGTIPIYYGCPNIEEWFNPEGIISFDTTEQLTNIISDLEKTPIYESKKAAIHDNYERALVWYEDNDKFFNKYLKEFV